MRCISLQAILAALAVASVARPGRAEGLPVDRGIGERVADVTLKDVSGKDVRLRDVRGEKASVVVFVATGCPVADLYLPRLGELAREYEPRGVRFVAVDSSRGEDPEPVPEHLTRHGAAFPVLMDRDHAVADALMAERTCEALVIDAGRRLRYRGAIDDQYTRTAHKDRSTRRHLAEALDAVLAGRAVAVEATAVSGCPIERGAVPARTPPAVAGAVEPEGRAVEVGRVKYAADVAPVIQRRCQECHRPGQVGPFSLLSYDDARRRSAAIREVVEERRMPPWHADPRHGRFANDRRLTATERATLLAWVDQDCPLGDPEVLPPPRTFPEGWAIGTPDVVFEMPEPYLVKAEGTLPYQTFRVPSNFEEDTWVQAVEVRPGEPSVVHHVTVTLADPKAGPLALLRGRDQYLAGYAPGFGSQVYPEGTAKLVPAGSELIFELHYTPVGREKSDRTKLGLILARTPPRRRVANLNICSFFFAIPPGEPNHEVVTRKTLGSDTTVLSLKPHMHLRGKDFKVTATYPDGTSEVLLSVPAYDFGWQAEYRLAEPKRLPKGTRIDCLAHFDNSAGNPANPDSSKTVRFGLNSDDEMMCGVFEILMDLPREGEAAAPASDRRDRKSSDIRAVRWTASAIPRRACPESPKPKPPGEDIPMLNVSHPFNIDSRP